MYFGKIYKSKIGEILIIVNEDSVVKILIENQKNCDKHPIIDVNFEKSNKILQKTIKWLDDYFNNLKPKISELNLVLNGSKFQKQVWQYLIRIPYGETTTYGEIAKQIAKDNNIKKMSAQAVGRAVGSNPISIVIPCHRVIGSNGDLTGYAGGLDIKINLLKLENVKIKNF